MQSRLIYVIRVARSNNDTLVSPGTVFHREPLRTQTLGGGADEAPQTQNMNMMPQMAPNKAEEGWLKCAQPQQMFKTSAT